MWIPRKKIQVCSTWNFSTVWRSWFSKIKVQIKRSYMYYICTLSMQSFLKSLSKQLAFSRNNKVFLEKAITCPLMLLVRNMGFPCSLTNRYKFKRLHSSRFTFKTFKTTKNKKSKLSNHVHNYYLCYEVSSYVHM